jgi:hypothetical protein
MTTLKDGIIQTANALGISPLVLATIIGYETGGTYNPTQAGPRTQYGQHRGLIQFGEEQARASGVDWNNALESQLGGNGNNAITRYLRAHGVRPGMGLLDVYSAVNAGAPGLYRSMDMGTSVSQKVHSDVMRRHDEKAAALVGGTWTPDMVNSFNSATANTNPASQSPPPPAVDPSSIIGTKADIPTQPGLTLGDTMAEGVRFGDPSVYGGPSDAGGQLPTLDFATAGATALPTAPAVDMSPLAGLFSLKSIGQAPFTQAQVPTRWR